MKYFPYEKENITVWKMLSMSISQRTCYKQLWNVQNVVSGSRILRGCILSRIIEDRNSWSLRPERLRLVGCLFMVVGFILLGMRGDRRSTYLVLGYLIHYWGWVAHVLGNIGRGRHHCQSWPSVSIQDPWIQNIYDQITLSFTHLISVTWRAFISSATSRSLEHIMMAGFFSS